MKNQNKNLWSKTTIQALQLLKTTSSVYAVEPATNFRNEFPALFKGLGLLQEPYRIRLRQDATPVCLYTPRRVPHPLLPKVKEQLQTMIQSEVISQVNEPIEWCQNHQVDLRICVDLTPLNKTVLREVHPMASVDERGAAASSLGSAVGCRVEGRAIDTALGFHPKFISLAQVVPGPIQPCQCIKVA